MRNLDFLNEPPRIYIFQKSANKSTFGGVIFFLFIIYMIFISLIYIYDYILNDKFEIEYSKFFSPIPWQKRKLLDSDPELNPTKNFILDGTRYIKNNFSKNFAFYNKNSGKFYDNVTFLNITTNVSSFYLQLLYKCNHTLDNECTLREEDKKISTFKDYFNFDLMYSTFVLNHSNPDPFEERIESYESFVFYYNNAIDYSLQWKVIKYKNEKSLFQFLDSWRGKKNEYIEGYIEPYSTTQLPQQYRYRGIFNPPKYKIIGSIQIMNLHFEYEEYKRKNIKFMKVLADICALFISIKGIIAKVYGFYSNSFDHYKMVKNIVLKKAKMNRDNDKKFELLPLSINDNYNDLNNNFIDNKVDDDKEPESLNFPKISFIHHLLNNIYCKKCGLNVQDRIETCNEIIKKYMSYEYILYNQMMLEQLLMDYKWNDKSLKDLGNNNLIQKLKNMSFDFT
jgi:hypothetical protein